MSELLNDLNMAFAINKTLDSIVLIPAKELDGLVSEHLDIAVIDDKSYQAIKDTYSLEEPEDDAIATYIINRLDKASGYGTPQVSKDGWEVVYPELIDNGWTPPSIINHLANIVNTYHEADASHFLWESDKDYDIDNMSQDEIESIGQDLLFSDDHKSFIGSYERDGTTMYVYSQG